MVLTAAQTTQFFTEADQMGLPPATFQQLAQEGITTVEDLSEFSKEDIDNLASTLRKTPRPGVNPAANFVFGAKSQKRLAVATEIVRYYNNVGRQITAANMRWTNILNNFEIQWKSLQERKKKDPPSTPKIAKGVTVMKWSESFKDHCHHIIGARNVALSYVIQENSAVPVIFPGQGTGSSCH